MRHKAIIFYHEMVIIAIEYTSDDEVKKYEEYILSWMFVYSLLDAPRIEIINVLIGTTRAKSRGTASYY